MGEWFDGNIEEDQHKLNNGQILALLRMTEALRDNSVYASVYFIKEHMVLENGLSAASEAWQELTEAEQTALWIAPSYGGIFTTEERKVIKNGFTEG